MEIRYIGLFLMIIGVFLGIIDKFLCDSLCNRCSNSQIFPCISLILFAGILLVIAGYATTKLKEIKVPDFRVKVSGGGDEVSKS